MAKKPGFTLEEHQEMGNTLKEHNRFFCTLTTLLHRAYPVPIANKAVKITDALAELRSALENKMFDEQVLINPPIRNAASKESLEMIKTYFG